MNKQIKLTIGIGLTVLLLVAVFATAAFAQGPGGNFGGGMMGGRGFSGMTGGQRQYGFGGMMGGSGVTGNGQGMMGGQGFGGMMGGSGMMGNGQGMMGGQGFGGMMGGSGMMGNGQGMMGGQGFGGMMGNGQAAGAVQGEPLTIDQAAEKAQEYLKSSNYTDLTLAEVMAFDNNFYALITEKSTGMGAFELLVNRYNGAVYPEPGPNMMWNTKYGHMGMGGAWNQQQGPVTVTVAQARTAAQTWLDANQPGAKLADDEMQFPGYYTMDFLEDGKTSGMLSVNGYTGQVWFHTWHGNFISEKIF